MTQLSNQLVEILLVEDNPGDVLLAKKILDDTQINHNVNVAGDGEIALDYLHNRNGFEDASRPDLMLLDLNMPKKDGYEVLTSIKEDPKLKSIPIIILTSSKTEQDVIKAYGMRANSYLIKPMGLDEIAKIAYSLEDFWLTVLDANTTMKKGH